MTVETSPLTEASKTSLNELFQRDPLKLTKDDIKTICQTLRTQRHQWMLEEKTKTPRGAKKKTAPLTDSQMDDLLADLEIKL